MARRMEVGGLVLQVPETSEELMQHMGARNEQSGARSGELAEFTQRAINLGPGGIKIAAAMDENGWGIFPGDLQTPEYTLALFKGLGFREDDPLVAWGIEARHARGRLAQKAGGALVEIMSERALDTNDAIGPEVLVGQLAATREAIRNPLVTVRIAPSQTLDKLAGPGVREASLILPNGESSFSEEISVFTSVGDQPATRQPANAIPEFRKVLDDILAEALSAADSQALIEQTQRDVEATL